VWKYDELVSVSGVTTFKGGMEKSNHYDYDAEGKLTAVNVEETVGQVTTKYNQSAFSYDSAGRVTSEEIDNSQGSDVRFIKKQYTYSDSGNRLTFQIQTATSRTEGVLNYNEKMSQRYLYDNADKLIGVKEGLQTSAPTIESYSYDGYGRRTETTRNQVDLVTEYSYNAADMVTKINNKNTSGYGDAILSSYDYKYFDNGLQKSVTENTGRKINYYYDSLGRLTDQAGNRAGDTQHFAFDVNNNRRLQQAPNTSDITYSYDAAGHLTGSEYDANGNLISDETKENEYDGFNQLIVTTVHASPSPDVELTYKYNVNGLRTEKTVDGVSTTYVLDGDNVVMELNSAYNQVRRYFRGFNLICTDTGVGEDKTYYNFNAHGDVTQLVNASETVEYKYDSFGNQLGTPVPNDTNPFRYAGDAYDSETGYIYLRARYYDPVTSCFVSEDSYTGEIGDPLSLNLYAYCGNDPVNRVDPSGHRANPASDNKNIIKHFKAICDIARYWKAINWQVYGNFNEFALQIIRKKQYSGDDWSKTAGSINGDFVGFMVNNYLDDYNYFNYPTTLQKYFKDRKGLLIDFEHFAATYNALIYWTPDWIFADGIVDNLAGWAGDLQSIMAQRMKMKNVTQNYRNIYNWTRKQMQQTNIYLSMFSTVDLRGDVDALNISKITTWDSVYLNWDLYYYGSELKYTHRYELFIKNRVGSIDKQKFVSDVGVYTKLYYGPMKFPLLKNVNALTEEQSNAFRDAFADEIWKNYLKE